MSINNQINENKEWDIEYIPFNRFIFLYYIEKEKNFLFQDNTKVFFNLKKFPEDILKRSGGKKNFIENNDGTMDSESFVSKSFNYYGFEGIIQKHEKEKSLNLKKGKEKNKKTIIVDTHDIIVNGNLGKLFKDKVHIFYTLDKPFGKDNKELFFSNAGIEEIDNNFLKEENGYAFVIDSEKNNNIFSFQGMSIIDFNFSKDNFSTTPLIVEKEGTTENLKLKIPNESVLSKIKIKGTLKNKKNNKTREGYHNLIVKDGMIPFKLNIDNTDNEISIFSSWFDYNNVLSWAMATQFSGDGGLALKDISFTRQPTEAQKKSFGVSYSTVSDEGDTEINSILQSDNNWKGNNKNFLTEIKGFYNIIEIFKETINAFVYETYYDNKISARILKTYNGKKYTIKKQEIDDGRKTYYMFQIQKENFELPNFKLNEEDRKLIEDMVLISAGFGENWKTAPRWNEADAKAERCQNSDVGKIKSTFNLGWNNLRIADFQNKTLEETINFIYKSHVNKNPEFMQLDERVNLTNSFMAALSQYISHPELTIGKLSNFNEAFLPFYLKLSLKNGNKIDLSDLEEVTDEGKTKKVLKQNTSWTSYSTYFQEDFSNQILTKPKNILGIPKNLKISNDLLIEPTKKVTIPTLPSYIDKQNLSSSLKSVDSNTSKDLKYLTFLPFNDIELLTAIYLKDYKKDLNVGEEIEVAIPNITPESETFDPYEFIQKYINKNYPNAIITTFPNFITEKKELFKKNGSSILIKKVTVVFPGTRVQPWKKVLTLDEKRMKEEVLKLIKNDYKYIKIDDLFLKLKKGFSGTGNVGFSYNIDPFPFGINEMLDGVARTGFPTSSPTNLSVEILYDNGTVKFYGMRDFYGLSHEAKGDPFNVQYSPYINLATFTSKCIIKITQPIKSSKGYKKRKTLFNKSSWRDFILENVNKVNNGKTNKINTENQIAEFVPEINFDEETKKYSDDWIIDEIDEIEIKGLWVENIEVLFKKLGENFLKTEFLNYDESRCLFTIKIA